MNQNTFIVNKTNEKQLYFKRQNIDKNTFLCISLHLLIKPFSVIPHTLNAEFLAPYFLLIIAKKSVCKPSDPNCFCEGCRIFRKYNKFFKDNPSIWQQVTNIYKYENAQILTEINKNSPLFEEMMKFITIFVEKYNDNKGNYEMRFSMCIYLLVINLSKIYKEQRFDLEEKIQFLIKEAKNQHDLKEQYLKLLSTLNQL